MRSYRFRMGSLTAVGALLIGLPACSSSQETPQPGQPPAPAPAPVGSVDEAAAQELFAATPVGRVTSRDDRGFARTISSSSSASSPIRVTAETAARLHLVHHADLLGAGEASIRSAALTGSHDVAGGGTIVQFEQRVNGIEVFRTRASVLLDADKNLVSIANGLVPAVALNGIGKGTSFKMTGEAAVANAYAARAGVKLDASAVRDVGPTGDFRGYAVTAPRGAMQIVHASAKQVYYPDGAHVVPAYYVEYLARAPGSHDNQGWGIVVSAKDGTSLSQISLTQFDAFTYRVWADPTSKIPLDGPIADKTPYPGGAPDGLGPTFIMPNSIAMEGFNKNPAGAADPWLASTATVTFGNNVEAYSDRNQYDDDAGVTHNDGYDEGGTALDGGFDFRADITSPLTFDRIYDTALAPNASVNQIKAAITQIFYTTNWMHDYWYDSGFNEAAKNAQRDNFGRGGVGGDPLHAEAQDSADSGQGNNANMSTFSDGTSPRMQMYVWNGLPKRTLTTSPGTSLTFPDGLGASTFGPQVFNITSSQAVLVNDGTAPTSDACEAITASLNNRVAVIDRGTCGFTVKVKNAQTAGAKAVILINNAAGHAPPNPGGADATITIPLLGVSMEDGVALKAALAAGTVNVVMQRQAEAQLDGTIDNTVVAHEWGHYLHHRLVLCGSQSCGGMSEGWGDFNALMLVIKAGDTFGPNVYPLVQYGTAGLSKNAGYFGIRRAPYSADLTKNPFTFKHIRQAAMLPTTAPLAPAGADMSEVHNVGEIWAQTLFQGYINLLAAGTTAGRTFDETKRRMADYVVAGMKGVASEPTFLEQRDAILRPIYMASKTDATRKADFDALAAGFAFRGLGSGAIAPPVTSTNLNEAVENGDTKGALFFESYTIDDSVKSCDNDGVLDAGEQGIMTIKLANNGWQTLTGSTVTVTSTETNLTFGNSGTATVASLDPYGEATVTIPVSVKAGTPSRTLAPLTITLANASAVNASVPVTAWALVNYDDKASVSSNDDVESSKLAWTPKQKIMLPTLAWSRAGDAQNHYLHGVDTGAPSDELLESPPLIASPTVPFILNFSHRYSFEFDAANGIYYDGGIIELSTDNGMTWADVATLGVDPGYSAMLYSSAPPSDGGTDASTSTDANPLAGKAAFGGESPGYPNYLTTSLNFGTTLAGKTVLVRFRIGTDEGGGAPGWDIDNVVLGGPQFSSITNTPFGAINANAGTCSDGGAPPADGGMGRPDAAPDANRADTGTGDGSTSDGGANDGPSDAPKADATTADAARDTGTTTTTTGAGGAGGGTTDDGCNCSVPGGRSSSGKSAAMLGVLGALSMVLRRRRRIMH